MLACSIPLALPNVHEILRQDFKKSACITSIQAAKITLEQFPHVLRLLSENQPVGAYLTSALNPQGGMCIL